jgi:hypothetical protein
MSLVSGVSGNLHTKGEEKMCLKKSALSFFCILLMFSCSQGLIPNSEEANALSESVSIALNQGSVEEMTSFSADLVSFRGNNREVGGIQEVERFRISMKEIDGEIFTRLDFPASQFADGIARSSLSSSEEMFLFKTASNELEQRIPLNLPADVNHPFMDFTSRFLIQAKIPNFTRFRSTMYDMNLDMMIEQSSLKVALPNEGYTKFELTFDLEEEVLRKTESEEILEDGTIVSSSIEYVYQEIEGELVKVGHIHETSYDMNYLYDDSDFGLPIIESEEEIEEMTLEEIQAMEDQGYLSYEIEPVLGDPADPDYTITEVQLYEDIRINDEDEAAFRILW